MKAYIVVGPTKLKPNFFNASLNASDSGIWASVPARSGVILLGVFGGGHDFPAMSDDACVQHQPFNVWRAKSRDFFEFEAFKDFAEPVALAQNSEPAQARLKTFQRDFLKQAAFVSHALAPLIIVVTDVVGESLALIAPRATLVAVRVLDEGQGHGECVAKQVVSFAILLIRPNKI